MRSKSFNIFIDLVILFVLSNCTAGNAISTPITPSAVFESTPALTAEPTLPVNEHFKTISSLAKADYLVRADIQTPVSSAWGPDHNLYIADFIGRRIVKMTPEGIFSELILTENIFWGDGPRTLAFSPDGVLYVNTHNSIYSIDENMTPHQLPAVGGHPLGSIAFSPSGELYYTNRDPENGEIRHWKDGKYEFIAQNLPYAENMAFSPDGTMYVSQMNLGQVWKVNVETHEISLFFKTEKNDPIYLAVDPEGDIWVRGIGYLAQLSPTGVVKPIVVDGNTYSGSQYIRNITTAAGFTFDSSGTIWVPAYSSIITKFIPTADGTADPEYHQELFYPGLSLMSIDTNSKGELFGVEWLIGQVDKIEQDKITPIGKFDCSGNAALAIDQNDQIFVSGCGKIMTVDLNGNFKDYAAINVDQMVFWSDGALYAIKVDDNQQRSLVKITGPGQITSLGDTFAGIPLGDRKVSISAWKGGFFLFVEKERKLISIDFEGNAKEVIIKTPFGGGADPVPMISTKQGKVMILPHGPYELYFVESDGSLTTYAQQISGDPLDFALSPDDQWLYIAECGAVIKMELK